MKPTNTRGATNNFIKPENWSDDLGVCGSLEVRAQLLAGQWRSVTSTWKPSAEDLAMLNAGGVLEVTLLRTQQPPMSMEVVAPILIEECAGGRLEIDVEPVVKPRTDKAITINEAAHGDLGHDEHGPAYP